MIMSSLKKNTCLLYSYVSIRFHFLLTYSKATSCSNNNQRTKVNGGRSEWEEVNLTLVNLIHFWMANSTLYKLTSSKKLGFKKINWSILLCENSNILSFNIFN